MNTSTLQDATPVVPAENAAPVAAPPARSPAPSAPAKPEPTQPSAELLPAGEHAEWDEFVLSHSRGSAFHTTWWYGTWGLTPEVRVLRGADRRIQAGICYAVGRRFGTRAMIRPPCTPGNGPVFIDTPETGNYRRITHAKEMAQIVLCSLPRLGFYDLRLRPNDTDVMPYLWNGFDTEVGYTFVIPASARDTWMEGTSKTTRKELRRGARDLVEDGLQIEENPEAPAMLPLILDTIRTKGFRIDRIEERFGAWWQAIRRSGLGQAYLLRDRDGNAMATDILVWDRHTAYSVLGGIRADLRKGSRAGTILLERMIRDAHGRGLDFDFEGSALPGVERFMRSFGGELRPMIRAVKIPSPIAFLVWQSHRFLTRHRRAWLWVD